MYNGDGCNAYCIIEYGYACTGGDPYTPDTCTEDCGDGINIGILPCDDGNTVDLDGCDSSCHIEPGWTCSGGSFTTKDTCVEDCGDGRNYGTFFCDDGNTVNGDGCDSNCLVEVGWTCTGGSPTSSDFCWRVSSRITQAYLSKNNTVITLLLNETHFMLNTFSKDDVFVFISGPRN